MTIAEKFGAYPTQVNNIRMKKIVLLLCIALAALAWLPQPQPSMKASMDRGKKVYIQYCVACHQADGGGIQRINPPLIKTDYVLGNKKRLIGIVLNGMTTGVEIDGEDYNNPMAPHNFLKDQEIADVLTYIRNSFGNKASVVTAAEVKLLRGK